jgi:RNA polymerase sigma factor (sigma-70 family)
MTRDNWISIIDDQEAYKELYRFYFKKFYNYGKKFTTNSPLIEDTIQEVFLDIWSKRQKLLNVKSVNAYFFSSFRYTLFRNIKQELKISGCEEFEAEPCFSIDYIIINDEIDEELQAKLKKALNALTAHQREAILLRFYENLSYEEVATILNISVKATYKIMARSLSALKENMLPLVVCLVILKAKRPV